MKTTLFPAVALALLSFAVAPSVRADTETVDGIEWTYSIENDEATVTGVDNASGDIVIPSFLGGCPVTDIGRYAFYDCTTITSVTMGDSVTSIGDSAFSYCVGLTSITIPDGVTSIGGSAFSDCRGLTSIAIPDSVTSIGSCAFWNCSELTSITIPDSVASIGVSAFTGCSGLASIIVGQNNTVYDSRNDCNAIIRTFNNTLIVGCKKTVIPSGVTCIGDSAFSSCNGLASITIPDSVTSIGENAFSACTGLASITIPDSVTSIGRYAFSGCSGLASIIVGEDNTVYDSRNGCNAIIRTADNSLMAGCKNTVIPAGVTSVGDSAFYYCSGLTSITLPDSVTSIGDSAFYYCSGLTSITIPEFLTSIGELAFGYCSGLTSITLPDSVTSIGSSAFYDCSGLTSITIPDSVTSIENYTFSYCVGLTSITIPDSVTSIGRSAFSDCFGLTSITLPDSVMSIGSSAFYDCSGLTSITIPDSVTSIGGSAFSYCSGLASVTIPYSLKDSISGCGLPESCEIVVRDKIPLAIATDATLLVALTDVSYSQPLAAVGGLQPYTWEIVDTDDWPTWLESGYIDYWDDWGCVAPFLSGTPYDDNIGTRSFALRVTDTEGTSVEKTFTLEVKKNPNKAPVVDARTPSVYELTLASGETVELSISAHDPNGDALSYRWYGHWYDYDDGDYQEGYHDLGVSGSGDSFAFSRPVGGEGIFYIGCQVSDGSLSSWANWRISVRNIPVVETEELPAATEGNAYSTTLTAHGGTAPYVWALAPSDYAKRSQSSTFAAVGEAQGWNDDDGCWTLGLPFAFPFYGGVYSQVRVNSNGTLNFDDSYFSSCSYSESAFLAHPMIAVLWNDLSTDDGDIYVESSSEAVTISWRCDYLYGGAVNASATLYPDGRIVLSYGAGNADGGFIGLSAGDGETQVVSSKSQSGSMSNAKDIVFVPAAPPAGMSLSEGGVLSGTPDEPGEFVFTVAVTDDAGETGTKTYTLVVAENGALRPGFASVDPEAGYVNMGADTAQTFEVEATHPTDGDVEIEWFLDGESVGTGATYAYTRDDNALHALRVVASATDLSKTAVREWKVGSMYFAEEPEDLTVAYGSGLALDAGEWFVSSTTAKITWFRAVWDENDPEPYDVAIAEGPRLQLKNVDTARKYYAQLDGALGRVRSRVFKVVPDPAPAVGRIYRMTGPAFVGNRLVLRAKTWGDPTGATFEWKRDGATVATTERLDIAALSKADFGTYTFTMTNPHGSATTEAFVLEEAKAGVPIGWGASDHGRTTAPEGLTGLAQVASGMNFNLGLRTDGTVAAWGYNGHGGCDVPEGLADVSFVAAGGYNSQGAGFAVKTDGSVAAWGQPAEIDGYWREYGHWENIYDDEGNWIDDYLVVEGSYWYEYTNGWDTVSTMPADLADVVKVAVGGEFAIALKADGSVVTWGRKDGYWEWDDDLGEDVWVGWDWNDAVPEYVGDVVDIAAGGDFAFVLLADGTAFPFGPDFDEPSSASMEAWVADDVVGIGANANNWTKAVWFVQSDGIAFGTTRDDWYRLADVPCSDVTAIDGGQYHAMALASDGNVSVWGGTWYGQDEIPAAVQGDAVGIAAGGYHCTAILPDADGDSISDAEEVLLGRDPAVYEDYRRLGVSGLVSVSGSGPASNAVVRLYDAAGGVRAAARTDENGAYSVSGLVPGYYFLKIEADGAVDIWQDGLRPSRDVQAPFAVVGGDRDDADFDLEPGQAPALVQVVLVSTADDGDGEYTMEDPPSDSVRIYLDMWPVEDVPGAQYHGLVDIGEVSASHADGLLSHRITMRPSEAGAATPSPVAVDGIEGETVDVRFPGHPESGSVTVVTDPAGADIWIDYADEKAGVSPLTVHNLAAASHALLIRKDGYLQPRPIQFRVEPGATTEVSVSLTAENEPAMSVMVSSAIPGMTIYVDYLPIDEVTPALVDGLDPASHAGTGWFSREHSILLRHPALSPFAPRAVPEWEVDPSTGDPIVPDEPPTLHIEAPNTYEWDASDRADFGVSLVEAPTLLHGGGTATVRWSVTNAGVVAATAPWKERVFLVNDAGLTRVAEMTVSDDLDVGASVVRTATFDVPADLSRSGDARIRVEIDPESAVLQVRGGLSDTATSGAIPFALPDFGVAWMSVPEVLPVGGMVELGWTVTNAGLGVATAPWAERVYLVNGAGETQLLEQSAAAPIAAGASAARTSSVSIPADLAAGGDARFRVEIDPEGAVLQVRGGLADTATSGAIPFALPDLGMAWTTVPEVLPVGGTVELGWTVRNAGLGTAAAPWTERVWIVDADGKSILTARNGEGVEVPVPVATTNASANLAAGGSVARTLSLDIDPDWFVEDEVRFVVDVDPETAPLQRDSLPDSAEAEVPSAFVTPDLGVSWSLLPAAEGELLPLGGEVSFGWIVTNAGLAATYAPWTERVYLRNGAGEFPVYEATASDALAAGASVERTASAVVPWAAMSGGAVEIRVEIDREGRILQNPDSLTNAAAAGSWDFSSDGWRIVVHTGTISGNETWGADAVHIVSGTVTVASGARLEIEPGAIVKFLDGAKLVVASGATCVANGAIFTHIADDTVGGDTMGDGGASIPVAGAYTIEGSGTIQRDETTEERWAPPVQTSGTLSGAQRWRGHNVYRVTGNLVLASGCTLTIDPGAIVKFDAGVSITVNSGATLDAKGSRPQPIVFTSVKDDSAGGDTNGNGDDSLLQPNDWKNVAIIGTAKFAHVDFRYGGGANDSLDSGMLVVRYGGSMTMDCCTIAHGFYDGVFSSGATEIANTAIYDCDRGVNSIGGTTTLRNCVIDRCRWGAMCEGGATILYNTIITRFYGSAQWPSGWGLAFWSGSLRAYNCCVWSDLPGSVISRSPYSTRTTDVIYRDPLFSDPDNGDFTLQAGSPCIDAGDSSYAPLLDAFGRPRMDVKSVADTGRPDADGICADIGIHEVDGVAAVPLPNLAVLSVTAPASAKAGDIVTVEYVVTNRGTAAVSASIRDTIRLKGDASVGGATVGAGTVAQSYDLPVGGAAVTMTARVTVPGIASGAWTFGVDVNPERDVYEQNLSDNRAWSDEATAMAADALAMGASEKLVPGGQTVGYALDGLPLGGGAAIIRGADVASLSARGAIGAVPVSGGGTPAVTLPDGSLLVVLPARDEGRTAYLAIENGGHSAARVSVEVVDASPRLLGVSPARIANEGTATLTLYGVGLSGATAATLYGRAATALEPVGTAQLLATFTADGLKTGPAAVAATVSGASVSLAGAVEIYTTKTGPKLVAWLDLPSNVRDGRVFAASVRYRNDGDTAMPMPCFKVYRDRYDYNTLLGIERNEMPAATALHLGGVSPTAPAGVLKPGEEGSAPFYFVPRGSYTIRLEHVLEDASAASAFPAFGGPEGYFEAVSAAATRLALRGRRAYDLRECVDLALKVRNGTPRAAATGRLLDAATAAPLAGVEIALVAADAESGLPGATATTAADGTFALDGLADGDYRWLLGNGARIDDGSTNVVSIADQADRNGLEVRATPGGRISGHVVCADGVPAANGAVALLDASFAVVHTAETDAFGFFSFAELADGAWAVQSAPADGWCAALATNLVVGAGARTVEATLVPVRGAILRGTVALADGTAVTNGFVQAISADGAAFEAIVESDGTWSIPGIPEGGWAVRHYAADLLSPDEDVELSAGDEVELALVSAERPLFVPTLSVGFGSCETSFIFTDAKRADNITSWSWDFDSDGVADSAEAQPTWTYTAIGTNTVTLTFIEDGETRTSVYADCVRVEEALETILKPNAIVFGTNSGTLSVVSVADGTLTLSGDPEAGTIEEGAVLLGQGGGEWFCRRVVAAEKSGGAWSLQTEDADLTDVYLQYAVAVGAAISVDETPAMQSSGPRRDLLARNAGGKREFFRKGGLTASVGASPDLTFSYVQRIKDGQEYEKWSLVGSIDFSTSLEMSGEVGWHAKESKDVPLSLNIPTTIPGLSVHADAELYGEFAIKAKGSGSVAANFKPMIQIGQERTSGGDWKRLPAFPRPEGGINPELDVEGSVEAKLGFVPKIGLKFVAAVGTVNADLFVRSVAKASLNKPASLKTEIGLDLYGEGSIEVFGKKIKIGETDKLEVGRTTLVGITGTNPDFDFIPSSGLSAPASVSFINQSKGETGRILWTEISPPPTGYEWDFGNGAKSSDANPSTTYGAEGRYDVTLRAKGSLLSSLYRKKKTVTVGKPDEIPDDGSRWQDDSQYDYTRKSWDPNEMAGPKGQGAERFVAPGQWMDYTVYFENHGGENVGDAYKIYVTNSLSPRLDWTTFEMGDVVFGADSRTDDGLRKKGGATGAWSSEIPLVEGTNVTVRTELSYDAESGLAVWYLRIVDPNGILGWPEDGSGFLPPNDDTRRGEGHITYRVKVREDAVPGDEIHAAATIVFDENAPIPTDPAWRNTVATIYEPAVDLGGGATTNLVLVVGQPYGPLPEPAAMAGYSFGGWFTGPNGTGRKVTSESIVQAGDSGLYAHWTPIGYTVKFNRNGGAGTMADQSIVIGATAKLSANRFTKSGSVFLGWAKTKAGAVAYANGASVKNLAAAGGTVTLYAQWAVAKYTVKFDKNGGKLPKGKKMAAQTMAYGKAAKLTKNVLARKGYVFAGWAVSKANAKKGVIAYANAQSVKNLRTDGKTTTLYAVWAKPTYKVAFVANGGKGKMAVQTFKYGKAAKLTANKFKAPKGKKFAGWAKSKADAKKGKVAYKNKKSVKNLVTTGKTVKLYAVWK